MKVGIVSCLIIQLHKTLGGWKDKYKKLTASLTQMLIMGEHNKFQSSTFCLNLEGVKPSPPLGYFNH